MRARLSFTFFLLVTLTLASTLVNAGAAVAQVVVPATRIYKPAPVRGGPAPQEVDSGAMLIQDKAEDEHPLVAPKPGQVQRSLRLQAFQQMQMDRRPTTILSVWSELELNTNDGQESAAEDGTDSGAGNNAAEEILVELNKLRRAVTLSEWDFVAEGIRQFDESEQAQAYTHLLQSLASGPPLTEQMQQQISQNPQLQQTLEKNVFSGEDVFAIAKAAPGEWEKAQLQLLGKIIREAIRQGLVIDDFLTGLRTAIAEDESEEGKVFTRADAVTLLTAAGQIKSVGEFLPTIADAELSGDIESLTLISQYCMRMFATDGDKAMLRKAWLASQAALAVPDASNDVRTAAIRQSVELAPQLEEGGGEKWLAESFTQDADRGMQILAVIGAGASTGLQQHSSNPSYRQKSLELQKTAVEALLKAAPERAAEWSGTLSVLARVWLNEAEAATRYSRSTSRNPMLQRDIYGNLYYMDPNQQFNQGFNQVGNIRAVEIAAIMKTRPNDEWMALLEDSLLPKLMITTAKLHLRVNEDKEAFPYIEKLATTHKDQATDLAKEFIRVWTRNHNPNQSAGYTDPYMYVYGFDVKAQSIPLTRSKQERNLDELAEWIARLRELQLDDFDEDLLTTAFTTCHSTAEVYRLETIQHVFGSLDALEPDTLASLAQRMRQNLTSIWRDPAVQQSASTNRKKQDLEAEVKAGYVVAHNVVGAGIKQHPENWRLQLAKAALIHDENDYLQELSKSSEFAPRRNQAFEEFAKAAELYAATVPELRVEEESTQVFEVWFYAMLGSCDAGGISHEKVPALKQIEHIKSALAALQGDAAQRHMDRFANLVFTRMSALNPAVKSRYLDAAFEVVGDNERAFEAKKVHEYYADLVQEIKLEAKVDGADVVGHDQPFGVFINIVHTPEIERESGGFAKYLQNQNNMMYAYNYGRPLENYRDKFRDAAIEVLSEHFEVMSVTFQAEDVNSRAIPGKYGWRTTPYAYVLLKSRSEAVDTLPPVRLDLDFLDTSGYVVLPIESPPVPLDCSGPAAPRPLANLEITQTLDERQSKEGKLILEVKAKGNGIIPTLDELVDIDFPGFKVQSTDDEDISITRFDPESRENAIVGERLWLITLRAEQSGEAASEKFTFASPVVEAKTNYQRYVDADLEDVAATISLEAQYGETSYAWVWWLIGGVGVVGLVGFFSARALWRPEQTAADRFQMPDRVTPFSVLSLLRDIEENNGLDDVSRKELHTSIAAIERSFFDKQDHDTPDLDQLASHWVTKSQRR